LIDAAFANAGGDIVRDTVVAESKGEARTFDVSAQFRSQQEGEPFSDSVAVLLSDVNVHVQARERAEEEAARRAGEVRDLEARLEKTMKLNEELRRANEDLATTNAQLRAVNEEFLVGNEELQSASEEVETLNEELQATNEELETLNEELQATVEELKTTTDDLQARSTEMTELAAERETQRIISEQVRQQLSAILDAIGDYVAAFDRDGALVVANAGYGRLFGDGTAFPQLEGEDGSPLDGEATPVARIRREQAFDVTFALRDHGGRRRFQAQALPLPDTADPARALLIIRELQSEGAP
jgi:two-component system CheB/CheR fusion protein